MAEKMSNLGICEPKYFLRHPLFVRTLAVNAQLSKPAVHPGGFPAIAISGNHELMPVASPCMSGDRRSKLLFSGIANPPAAVLGSGRVTHRLVNDVTSIA